MAVLYGRAGRLTSQNGGFRPGQVGGVVGAIGGAGVGAVVGVVFGRIVASEIEVPNMLVNLV
jgi:hypothetical protein